MLPILTPEDFTGYYLIKDDRSGRISEYIEELEPQIILELLGASVLREIVESDPLPEKYNDLINGGLFYQDECDETNYLLGFKKVLLGFIYCQWYSDDFSARTTGKVREHNENSVRLTAGENKQSAYSRYNKAVDIWNNNIIPFIAYNDEKTGIVDSFTDNGAGNYSITLDSAEYLVDGQLVEINGVEYTVINLDSENNTFDINAETEGIDFIENICEYTVYNGYNQYNIKSQWL